jgi:cell division septum initiation protein DivIVA
MIDERPCLDVVRVYDRTEFQQFLARLEAERDRLKDCVATAHRRLAEAEQLSNGRSTALQDRVAALLLDAQELIEDHRKAYGLTLETIERCAEEKAERILKMARNEADALRGRVPSPAERKLDEVPGAAEVLEFAAEGRRIRAARLASDADSGWRASDAGVPAS